MRKDANYCGYQHFPKRIAHAISQYFDISEKCTADADPFLGVWFVPQGPHYLTIMKPPLNLPLKMAEWQETSVNAFV